LLIGIVFAGYAYITKPLTPEEEAEKQALIQKKQAEEQAIIEKRRKEEAEKAEAEIKARVDMIEARIKVKSCEQIAEYNDFEKLLMCSDGTLFIKNLKSNEYIYFNKNGQEEFRFSE